MNWMSEDERDAHRLAWLAFFNLWRVRCERGEQPVRKPRVATLTKKEAERLEQPFKKFWKYRRLVSYGGACACCGERYSLFLSIDHVNGQGSTEFQALCLSCNQAKARKRECPHQTIRRIERELEAMSEAA